MRKRSFGFSGREIIKEVFLNLMGKPKFWEKRALKRGKYPKGELIRKRLGKRIRGIFKSPKLGINGIPG